jgi:hypothetical protein
VRAGRCAAVGVVTKLVDVHATLSIWVVALDIPCDGGGGAFGLLLEGNGTGDLRVTSDGSNCTGKKTLSAKIRESSKIVRKGTDIIGCDGRME